MGNNRQRGSVARHLPVSRIGQGGDDLIDRWDALNSTNKSGVLTMLNSTNKSGVLTIWPGLEGIIEYRPHEARIARSTETAHRWAGIGDSKPGDTRQDPPGEPEYPNRDNLTQSRGEYLITLPNASISGNVSPPTLTAPHQSNETRPSTHGEQSASSRGTGDSEDPDPDPAFFQEVHSVPNVPVSPAYRKVPIT